MVVLCLVDNNLLRKCCCCWIVDVDIAVVVGVVKASVAVANTTTRTRIVDSLVIFFCVLWRVCFEEEDLLLALVVDLPTM